MLNSSWRPVSSVRRNSNPSTPPGWRPPYRISSTGGIFGTFIDWRGYPTVHSAATKLELIAHNLIVWGKTNASMGSHFRSQHELLPLFKKGKAPHVNNVKLGKNGRWRSNLWIYPGASSMGS